MLKIIPLNQNAQERHLDLLGARFYDGLKSVGAVNLTPYDDSLLTFLETHLVDILIGSPLKLESIARDVQRFYQAFSDYAALKNKGNTQKNLVHRNTLKIIEESFNYKLFSQKSEFWNAYELVHAHGLRICPYCHGQHVNYHIDFASLSSEKKYLIRPPLDHFFPKSVYPYFAVSLNNLVPSCAQCNSSVKSALDPLEIGIRSPHDPTCLDISFSAVGSIPQRLNGTVHDIKVKISSNKKHSKKLIKAFLLQDRYQWYKPEIKDIIERYAEYKTIPTVLRKLIPHELYVLGYNVAQAEERIIGICLRDIYKELISGKLV